ncbi:MAG: YggT family protein [Atopobiaceae bacterium]|nr:YggT family protein [Atopobiaceae bacterium]
MFNIVTFVMRLFDFYQILIVIWCILSWIPIPRDGILGDIVGALNSIVSPYINLFRRFIPPLAGIDFSPILAVLVLQLIERFILGMLI